MDQIEIRSADTQDPATLSRLRKTVLAARSLFEANLGRLPGTINLDLAPRGKALRTSYSPSEDVINFPKMRSIVNRGLNSEDVVIHESFHAMISRAYPQYSTKRMLDDRSVEVIHEALADYFTYRMRPDEHFGEDYYKEKTFVREYLSGRRVSLSPGTHSKANALTGYLIKHDVSWAQIKSFLDGGDFSLKGLAQQSTGLAEEIRQDQALELERRVQNYEPSEIDRYRLESGRDLQVAFEPNAALQQAHPNLEIEWVNGDGEVSKQFVFEEAEDNKFLVKPTSDASYEKILALFKDGEDLLGSRPFYLSLTD